MSLVTTCSPALQGNKGFRHTQALVEPCNQALQVGLKYHRVYDFWLYSDKNAGYILFYGIVANML